MPADAPTSESEDRAGHPRTMRLQKFLARAGAASRRGSEDLMTAGRVSVNGAVVTELGSKVDPDIDTVCVDGSVVRLADGPVTLMLNKPAGVLTTMSDPHGRPTVASLVPRVEHPGLFPVGRLDMDTTGLLLFTTDGELGQHLLHPAYHVEKTYLAEVDGVPDESSLDRLREGIVLDDGPTAPATVELARAGQQSAEIRITIHEGRKRQVKRMCSAIGHPVARLHRESVGPLFVGDLATGSWRELDADEDRALRTAAGLL